jgi:hypothetical protein
MAFLLEESQVGAEYLVVRDWEYKRALVKLAFIADLLEMTSPLAQ